MINKYIYLKCINRAWWKDENKSTNTLSLSTSTKWENYRTIIPIVGGNKIEEE